MAQQKVARDRKAPIPEAYSQRPAHHRCASTRYQTSPFLKAFAYQSFTKSRNCVARYKPTACAPSNSAPLCRALLTRAWLHTLCTNLGTALTSASKASGNAPAVKLRYLLLLPAGAPDELAPNSVLARMHGRALSNSFIPFSCASLGPQKTWGGGCFAAQDQPSRVLMRFRSSGRQTRRKRR
jgi:hypothetical protein